MSRLIRRSLVVAALALAFLPGRADASLTVFQTYNGQVGYSSDGFGSLSQSGVISASVPLGSTVLAAYLYTGVNAFSGDVNTIDSTLNGIDVTYGPLVANATACCGIASARADVTAIVAAVIDGGLGGVYNFTVTEASGAQDGEALVVVYSNPSLPVATVGILDGFASVTGDSATISFADPLNPAAPGFFAEMIIGDNFSCCQQRSTIVVNGTTMTENAGNFDDGDAQANGSLITVGSFDDPFSPLNPTYETDTERYNLIPFITAGDTSITVRTVNASEDDNIFLAVFHVTGEADITTVPDQPETLLLLGLGLAALWAVNFRRA
ncbi:MAG: hypothetical protein ACRD1W_12875 [Vicinamibacterales bacterium]